MRRAVLTLTLALLAAPALAQDAGAPDGGETGVPSAEQLEEARQLFADGVRYAGEGEFERAVIAFRRAKAIKDAPAIRFNLSSALYETRELGAAAAEAQSVVDDAEAPEELRQRARGLVTEIRRQMATLTIRLGGQADGARVDDRSLAPGELDEPLYLEPGTHVIVGLRRGEEMTRREIEIPAGGQAHVDVSVIPSPAETAAAATTDDDADPGATPLTKDWRFWAVVGGAVVAIVVVVVIVAAVSGGTEDPVEGNFQPGVIEW
ncbi:MAG: hypothetical protein CMN30_11860 [Sandaracinus sp.]|nr:hypothetical protein [Sandaracinus sp.]